MQNQSNYTWVASTTDPRALQTVSGTGRIASTGTVAAPSPWMSILLTATPIGSRSTPWIGMSAEEPKPSRSSTPTPTPSRHPYSYQFQQRRLPRLEPFRSRQNQRPLDRRRQRRRQRRLLWRLHLRRDRDRQRKSPERDFGRWATAAITATVTGTPNQAVTWSIVSVNPSSAPSGSISTAWTLPLRLPRSHPPR